MGVRSTATRLWPMNAETLTPRRFARGGGDGPDRATGVNVGARIEQARPEGRLQATLSEINTADRRPNRNSATGEFTLAWPSTSKSTQLLQKCGRVPALPG